MKVRYRANGEIRDVSDEAARSLIDAAIADAADESPVMTMESMPPRTKRAK